MDKVFSLYSYRGRGCSGWPLNKIQSFWFVVCSQIFENCYKQGFSLLFVIALVFFRAIHPVPNEYEHLIKPRLLKGSTHLQKSVFFSAEHNWTTALSPPSLVGHPRRMYSDCSTESPFQPKRTPYLLISSGQRFSMTPQKIQLRKLGPLNSPESSLLLKYTNISSKVKNFRLPYHAV